MKEQARRSVAAGTLRNAYVRFRSPRTTMTIILALFALYVLGLIIPQKASFTSAAQYDAWRGAHPMLAGVIETLRLNDIYLAPITILFLALFFLNLIVVLFERLPSLLRRSYLLGRRSAQVDPAGIKRDPSAHLVLARERSKDEVTPQLAGFFRGRSWWVVSFDDGLVAVRNRYSPLGFLFFHVSFLLCLIGGLLIMYTRFSGNLVLTEGQEFQSDLKQFRTITRDPKIMRELPPIGLLLQKVVPRYEGNVRADLSVLLRVRHGRKDEDVSVRINEPVKRGPLTVLAGNIGVSPLFVLRTPDQRTLDGGYVSLNILTGDEDSFVFRDSPYTVAVRLYPDHAVREGRDVSLSRELKNPVVRLRAERGGRAVKEATLGMGQRMAFDNLQLSFEDVRYWVEFHVVREYGDSILILGFFLGIGGLVMRLILYQKTVSILIEEPRPTSCLLYIQGRSEHFQYSYAEELAVLIDDLAAALNGVRTTETPPATGA